MKKEYVGLLGIIGVILSFLGWGIAFEIAFAVRISDGTLANPFVGVMDYLSVQSILCLAAASIISLLCVFMGFVNSEKKEEPKAI